MGRYAIGHNSPTRLNKLVQSQTLRPLLKVIDKRLSDLGMKYQNTLLLSNAIKGTRIKLLGNEEKPSQSSNSQTITHPEQLQLESTSDAKATAKALTIGFARSMKDWVSSLGVTGDIKKSVYMCASFQNGNRQHSEQYRN